MLLLGNPDSNYSESAMPIFGRSFSEQSNLFHDASSLHLNSSSTPASAVGLFPPPGFSSLASSSATSGFQSGHFSCSSTNDTSSPGSMSDHINPHHDLTTSASDEAGLRKVKSVELDASTNITSAAPRVPSAGSISPGGCGTGDSNTNGTNNGYHAYQSKFPSHFPASSASSAAVGSNVFSLDSMMSSVAINNNNNNVVDIDALSNTSSGIVTQCSSIPSPAGGSQQHQQPQQPPSFPHSQLGFNMPPNFRSPQQQQLCELFSLLDMQNQPDLSIPSSMGMPGMGGGGGGPAGMLNRMSLPGGGGAGGFPQAGDSDLLNAKQSGWNMPPPPLNGGGDQDCSSLFHHQQHQAQQQNLMMGNQHGGFPSGKRAITGAHNQMRNGPNSGGGGGMNMDMWKSASGPMGPASGMGSGGGGGVSPSSTSSSSMINNPWSRAVANQKLGLAPVPVNSGLMGGGGSSSGVGGGGGSPSMGCGGMGGMMQRKMLGSGGGGLDMSGGGDSAGMLDMFNMLTGGNGSQGREEQFSRKVFVGGLPPDIDEEEITDAFRRFGPLVVDWPHKVESKSYFPPKGYCFLLFQDERYVQKLTEACIVDNGKYYWCVSSATIRDKPVQIRPWCLGDSDFVMDGSQPLDPRKTIFVGGVPRPLRACELAMIMGRLYGGVCYAGIDTDPELRYPKGAGRVAFSSQQSYIAAISARFVHLQHGDMDKRVEVKPYVLDDQMCDECHGVRCGGKFAPFFCANVTCLQYYCEQCWAQIHNRQGREYHKPLVKEGADRPRTVPFRY